MKVKIFVILLLNSFIVLAQTHHNYPGVLVIDDNSVLPYYVVFNDESGVIEGYSVSDSFGLDETRSFIKGNIKNNRISFRENDIVYTKSNIHSDDFCFLEVQAKLKRESGLNVITGEFIGYYMDSAECVSGKIQLIDSLSFIRKVEKKAKKNQNKESLRLNENEIVMLEEDQNMEIQTNSSRLIIHLWDSGRVDNDIVSVKHNNSMLLSHYSIKKKKRSIEVDLVDGVNKFEFIAVNNGKYGPNSARVEIQDINRSYQIATVLNVGKSTNLIVNKE